MAIGTGYGKYILFGEHFVVHGAPAIALPTANCVEVNVEVGKKGVFPEVYANEINLMAFEALKKAVEQETGESFESFRVEIISATIPIGAGMGSSAAFAVAVARGLLKELGIDDNPMLVNRLAHEMEMVYHGNPSGIDDTVATYAKPVVFTKGEGTRFISMNWSPAMIAVDSGFPRSTKAMVQKVGELKQREPSVFESLMNSARLITKYGELYLQSANVKGLGDLMNINQGLLNGIGVSIPAIEKICSQLRESGASGAKLSGGGGGGIVLGLFESKRDAESFADSFREIYSITKLY
ncbi:MAG: mevalonate kinase [Candidatus Anstonellales archaeon]